MQLSDDETPGYSPPGVVSILWEILSAPRIFHSTDVSNIASQLEFERKDYRYGLIFTCTIILVFFFIWTSILIMLKLRGKSVGCASGSSFHHEVKQTVFLEDPKYSSRSFEEFDDNDSSIATNSTGSKVHNDVDEHPYQEREVRRLIRTQKSRRRERRTRSFFVLSGLLIIGCSAAILLMVVGPLKDVAKTTDSTFTAAQDVIDQVESNIRSIESACEHASFILETYTFDVVSFCPSLDEDELMGSELAELTSLVASEYEDIDKSVRTKVGNAKDAFALLEDNLENIQNTVDNTDEYLWLIPGMLLVISLVAMTAVFGVGAVMKGDKKACIQKGMTWIVLPLLIATAMLCMVTTIAAAIGTMITGDACTGSGSPHATILNVLEKNNVNETANEFIFVASYTGGCKTADPTEEIMELQATVESTVASIWQHISGIDSVGREEVSETCGRDVSGLVNAARDLANILTSILKNLDSASDSLDCDRISPIYVEAVHNTLCTDVASGSAWGFVLFLFLTILVMVMISLRASWVAYNKHEEMYDENDGADNMVLNEHEEYLEFVSRYKHEWQEYDGINTNAIKNEEAYDRDSWTDGESDYDGEEFEVEYQDDEEDPNIPEEVSIVSSVNTADISFPSLNRNINGNSLALPPLALPTLPALIAFPPLYSPGRSFDSAEISLPHNDSASDCRSHQQANKMTSQIKNDRFQESVELLESLANSTSRVPSGIKASIGYNDPVDDHEGGIEVFGYTDPVDDHEGGIEVFLEASLQSDQSITLEPALTASVVDSNAPSNVEINIDTLTQSSSSDPAWNPSSECVNTPKKNSNMEITSETPPFPVALDFFESFGGGIPCSDPMKSKIATKELHLDGSVSLQKATPKKGSICTDSPSYPEARHFFEEWRDDEPVVNQSLFSDDREFQGRE